jgi:hypothetical protein
VGTANVTPSSAVGETPGGRGEDDAQARQTSANVKRRLMRINLRPKTTRPVRIRTGRGNRSVGSL